MVFVPMAKAPRWRKRSVVQSKFDLCRFAQEGLPRKQAFVDISVFL